MLDIETEMTRLLNVLPYRRIFMVDEPVYEEIVCEFLATFENHADFVTFRLGGVDRMLSMRDLGIAFGIWTEEETRNSPIYTSAIREFKEDCQIYWSHIATEPSIYSPIRPRAYGLRPSLRYLHYILVHTITGPGDNVGVINSIEVAVLSHICRGISVDFSCVFAMIAQDYGSDPGKKTLGLGPFITRVARYFKIDLYAAGVRLISGSTAPVNHRSLMVMGLVSRPREAHILCRPRPRGRRTPSPPKIPPLQQQQPPPPTPHPDQASSSSTLPLSFEHRILERLDRIDREIAAQRTFNEQTQQTLLKIQVSISELLQRVGQQSFETPP